VELVFVDECVKLDGSKYMCYYAQSLMHTREWIALQVKSLF